MAAGDRGGGGMVRGRCVTWGPGAWIPRHPPIAWRMTAVSLPSFAPYFTIRTDPFDSSRFRAASSFTYWARMSSTRVSASITRSSFFPDGASIESPG